METTSDRKNTDKKINNENIDFLIEKQKKILSILTHSGKTEKRISFRCNIALLFMNGIPKKQIVRKLKTTAVTVRKWCRRWEEAGPHLCDPESLKMSDGKYMKYVASFFKDAPRPGAPPTFSAEQIALIMAMACEVTDNSDKTFSRRSRRGIAKEAVCLGTVKKISKSTVHRFLKKRT